jgi:transposase
MKTQDDVSAMLRLKARGWGLRRIAAKLRCSRNTVRRWLAQGEWRPHPSRFRPDKLDGLSDWLRERFHLHAGNTDKVRQELAREKNIIVSLRTVERAVAPLWRELVVAIQARQAAFEWMRAILQKDIDLDVLRHEVGDIPDIATLLQHLYDGRLSDRNRSMVVLASRRGLSGGLVRSFLGIAKTTHRKCLRMFEDGGCTALFARQSRPTKFSDEVIKQAVFGLLHEPPSNYGINRTTWIMSDLTRVLRETVHPACREVICKITKAPATAGAKRASYSRHPTQTIPRSLIAFAPSSQGFARTKPSSP